MPERSTTDASGGDVTASAGPTSTMRFAVDYDGCVGDGRPARAVDECCALQNLHAMPPAKTRPKVFLSPPCVKEAGRRYPIPHTRPTHVQGPVPC